MLFPYVAVLVRRLALFHFIHFISAVVFYMLISFRIGYCVQSNPERREIASISNATLTRSKRCVLRGLRMVRVLSRTHSDGKGNSSRADERSAGRAPLTE